MAGRGGRTRSRALADLAAERAERNAQKLIDEETAEKQRQERKWVKTVAQRKMLVRTWNRKPQKPSPASADDRSAATVSETDYGVLRAEREAEIAAERMAAAEAAAHARELLVLAHVDDAASAHVAQESAVSTPTTIAASETPSEEDESADVPPNDDQDQTFQGKETEIARLGDDTGSRAATAFDDQRMISSLVHENMTLEAANENLKTTLDAIHEERKGAEALVLTVLADQIEFYMNNPNMVIAGEGMNISFLRTLPPAMNIVKCHGACFGASDMLETIDRMVAMDHRFVVCANRILLAKDK